MGLASKIKNASSAQSTTPQQPHLHLQPQQHAASSPPAPLYDYPHPQQRTSSYDATQQQPLHSGAPSAPPFPAPQQLYAAAYPAPLEHPHRQSHVESTPYPGQALISPSYAPYTGQGPPSPSYRDQVLTPSVFSAAQMQPAASIEMLAHKLQAIIQANGLQSFYDQARFQATLRQVSYINFSEIAAEWHISIELAYDLAPLVLYDIVFYCDDSGSMAFEEDGERIDDLKLILSKVSGIATKFDDDGIIVRFMNSDVNGDGIRNAADVASLISRVRFSGLTPLGTNFDRKVIQPFVLGQANSNMAKPVLAIIITDGEPSGEDHGTIRQVIHRAKDALMRTRYGGGAFAVQIAQVGKDARTQKFLESLDKDPVIGGMIDCTSYYELEEEEFARKGVALTPELWLLKMCVGAIDPEYDSKDD